MKRPTHTRETQLLTRLDLCLAEGVALDKGTVAVLSDVLLFDRAITERVCDYLPLDARSDYRAVVNARNARIQAAMRTAHNVAQELQALGGMK